jgi:hypothetical protein
VRKQPMMYCPSSEARSDSYVVLTPIDIDTVLNFTIRGWLLEAIWNAAAAGNLSNDRTSAGYAARTWEGKSWLLA